MGKKYHFFLHLHPRVHLFNILCDEMGSTHNTFPLHTKRMDVEKETEFIWMAELWAEPLWHWISGTHFLENEISLSLYGKQLTELDTNDKIQVFMWNGNFGNCTLGPLSFIASLYLKTLLMRSAATTDPSTVLIILPFPGWHIVRIITNTWYPQTGFFH